MSESGEYGLAMTGTAVMADVNALDYTQCFGPNTSQIWQLAQSS